MVCLWGGGGARVGVAPRRRQHDLPGSPAGWSPTAMSLIFSVRWAVGGGRRRPRGFAGAAGCPRWWRPPLQPRVPQTGAEDGCPQSAPCWPTHTSPRMAAAWRSSEVPWPVRHCSDPRPVASPSLLRSQTRGQSVAAPIPDPWPVRRCSDPRPGELHTPPASWVLFRCRQ